MPKFFRQRPGRSGDMRNFRFWHLFGHGRMSDLSPLCSTKADIQQ
jgi:hypothetical protein